MLKTENRDRREREREKEKRTREEREGLGWLEENDTEKSREKREIPRLKMIYRVGKRT